MLRRHSVRASDELDALGEGFQLPCSSVLKVLVLSQPMFSCVALRQSFHLSQPVSISI